MSNENLSKLLALTADLEAMEFYRIAHLCEGMTVREMRDWGQSASLESAKWFAAFNELIK